MATGYIRDLVIVGAGGSAREIAWAVEECNARQPQWNLLGFVDDNPALQGTLVGGHRVLGPLAEVDAFPQALLIIGVASYKSRGARQRIVERLGLPAERYATVIAPTALCSPLARIGAGSAVLHQAMVHGGAEIGRHVVVSSGCNIGHNALVEDYVTMAARAVVSGSTQVGTGAYLGAGSVVRDGIKLGENALIGLGAAVFRDVPAGQTVVGNPAVSPRKLRGAR